MRAAQKPGERNPEHELQDMTEGLCAGNLGSKGKGGRKMRRERRARPARGEGCLDHSEELGIPSDYTRKPLKH